jgi:hypothetical protein
MEAKPFGDPRRAHVLVIGHDPRLQRSDTIAPFCFFADYYFRPIPNQPRERAKYELAAELFSCIRYLTGDKYPDDQILVTNLCNKPLRHAPKGKTVLIPEPAAHEGLQAIRVLLSEGNVTVIFAMSLQVNYWLQKLGFYLSEPGFITDSEPKQAGLRSDPPYYQPARARTFQRICGNRYIADDKYTLFPILHIKQWPLHPHMARAYGQAYERCRDTLNTTP